MRAAPAVSCAKIVQRNAHEHTGSAEAIRHSLRNGFTAYGALSPATNSSCHRHRRINGFAKPGRADKDLRRLDTSNGRQNHTLLPYALAPFVLRAGESLTSELALQHRFAPTLLRPPHPYPTFVTTRDRPSYRERMGRAGSPDLPDGTSGILPVGLICRRPVGRIGARRVAPRRGPLGVIRRDGFQMSNDRRAA